jgi:hypothetical protein
MNGMSRHAAAVALGSLALITAACGGRAAASSPLSKAVDRTKEQGTARLLSVKRGSASGLAYVHRSDGVVDYAHQFSSITKRSTIGGGGVPVSRAIKLGDDLYTQIAGHWLHEQAGHGNTTGDVDPTHLLMLARDWGRDVSIVGHQRVRGASTTVYRASIDLRAAVEQELRDAGWSDGATEQFLGDELKGPASLKVWVGTDGVIRRVVLTSSSETESLQLFAFGVSVDAHAPVT